MKPKFAFSLTALTTLVLSILSLPLPHANSAFGSLDLTFNGTGESLVGFGGASQNVYAEAVQSDGKLVLAGRGVTAGGLSEFQIMRFGTNNALDPTFGAGGVVITGFSPPSFNTTDGDFGSAATAVAIQSDGKIVAAGWADTAAAEVFALARYNTNGTLDTSFGTGGQVAVPFGFNQAAATAIALPGDGTIVVAGSINNDFGIARYTTNGVLDTSFGSTGYVMTDTGGGLTFNGATGLTIQPDGPYVTVGVGDAGADFAVVRYATNGALDTSFGGTGIVLTPIPRYSFTYASAVSVQFGDSIIHRPNRIVVAGNAGSSGSSDVFALARYNLDGTLDNSFGTNGGTVTGTYSSDSGLNYGFAVSASGGLIPEITVAGWHVGATGSNYVGMAQITASGSLNTSFGPSGTGKATLPVVASGGLNLVLAMTVNSGEYELACNLGRDDNGFRFVPEEARFTSAGILDTSFGANGVTTEDVCSSSSAVRGLAIQPDGRIVGAGYNLFTAGFALARYNPDGSLDSAFGLNGKVTTIFNPTNAANALAVQVQPDGKIVAAGDVDNGKFGYESALTDFALARYTTNGSLDASFGSGGKVMTPVGQDDVAFALALQPDGKIVTAGRSLQGLYDYFAVVRYTTNGALDTSFGGTGKVTTLVAGGESDAYGIAIQPDAKIIAAGYAEVGSNTNFALVRFLTNGALDTTFGSSGAVTTDFGGGISAAQAVAIQSDGKILAAGSATVGGVNAFALARYLTNGTLDTSFGMGGKVTTQFGVSNDIAFAVAELQNGKILAAGWSEQPVFFQCAIARYNPDGSLDSSFGSGGKTIIGFADGSDSVNALVLDQIGRAILGANANGLFGVARLTSDPILQVASISGPSNGVVTLQGFGVPATSNTLQFSSNLAPGSFNPLASVTTDASGFWQYQDTSAAQASIRFYRLSYP